MSKQFALAVLLGFATLAPLHAELRVPGFTAYFDPDPEGARVSEKSGVTRWKDPAIKVLWFGEIKTPGKLECALQLRLPAGKTTKLRLSVAGQSREASVTGVTDGQPVTLRLGELEIKEAGYQRFTLESLNAAGEPFGEIDALVLDGPATKDAHFNLLPRRNAASVHLMYPTPKDAKITAFYSEVTAVDDPIHTFYMAAGFRRGYFGMQVNRATERRIIFSVWDAGSGSTAMDRSKVAAEDHVQLLAKGDGVEASVFGGEGTGGHSHLVYPWKTGETQKFVVTAKPEGTNHTIYTGYYFHPERKVWMLIASFKAPKDGGYLRGLHGFSENFGGSNGHLRRKSLHGNQWMRVADGGWQELTDATFSHDGTGKKDRLDRFMGLENGSFFLSHGGFVAGFTTYGEKFTRPATGIAPAANVPKD
jgi:hypothetical protein